MEVVKIYVVNAEALQAPVECLFHVFRICADNAVRYSMGKSELRREEYIGAFSGAFEPIARSRFPLTEQ
jgi:hypothetical protein